MDSGTERSTGGSVRGSRHNASRAWKAKKKALHRDLVVAAAKSPVLRIEHFAADEGSVRALVTYRVPTLVTPERGELRLAGPCVVAIRYHARWLVEPPIPWEVVTVFHPLCCRHPNIGKANGLCLGATPAGLSMTAILEQTYAALTLSSYNTVEWEGLDADAAAFVRAHADRFPIVPTGLYEAPPADLWPDLDLDGPPLPLLPLFRAVGKGGDA